MVLRTPPPYGGGEMRAGWLNEQFSREQGFAVLTVGSRFRTRVTQGRFAPWKLVEFLGLVCRFVPALLRHRPRVVYISMGKEVLPFMRDSLLFWIARLHGASVVTELAGERFALLDGRRLSRWYGRLVLSRMASVRMLSESIAERHRNDGVQRIAVFDNGVRLPSPLPKRQEQPTGSFTFLFVGAHTVGKGFDTLLKACAVLHDRGHRATLCSIGRWQSDAFRRSCDSFVAAHALEDWFEPAGLCRDDARWTHYADANALVLPSLTEGQPLSVLEAFGFGLPVVCTPVGGLRDVVEPKHGGLLVEPGETDALANAMEELIWDPDLCKKMGEHNRQRYEARFSEDVYIAKTREWLQGIAR